MNFLKSLLIKIKAKTTLKTYQKPLMVTIITLLIINFIILIIGAVIGLKIDNTYYYGNFFHGKFLEAFVTSIKWMIAPTTIISYDAHEALRMLILAVVIVVIEMVLFSGAIIAMVTTSLRAYIDKKSKAKGKIIVSDHFIILNWNSKVPDVIYNLMEKGYSNNIVILSNQNKEYIENEVKSLFLTNETTMKSKANLIIKEGNPLLRGNLEDISIDKAKHILVMAREDMSDGDDDNILNSDLLNLKIVLRIGSFDIAKDCQVVVETDSDETRGQIENLAFKVQGLKQKHIIPVSFNKKIGQVISQSIISPIMSDVYLELFSFSGSEFYSVDTKESIHEYMQNHSEGIAVCKLHKLFVLALNERETTKKRGQSYTSSDALKMREHFDVPVCTIFVIGENKKSAFILDNLEKSAAVSTFKYVIKTYHKNENAKLISDIKETAGLKKVLVLSDDNVSEDSYDANVFVTLIELTKAFPKRENLTLITELLDSRNLSSVRDFDIQNTIISNRMMSLLLTQLAMNDDSKRFFEQLLTVDAQNDPNDFDLAVAKIKELFDENQEFTFTSKKDLLFKFYNTFNGKKILIGMYKNNQLIFLNENQDKEEEITLSLEDSLIYITY